MSFKYTDLPNSQVATHGLPQSRCGSHTSVSCTLCSLQSHALSLSLVSCTRDYMFCKYVFLLFFSFCVLTALFRLL